MKANLHVHSNYSDGTKTLKEIDELAKLNGIDIIAITDHDCVDCIREIKELNSSIKYIIGVEMSCVYNKESIHILGYFNDGVNDNVVDFFHKQQIKMKDRCLKIIANLKEFYNIEIDYDTLRKNADGVINSAHIANAIVDKYGYDFQEVYDRLIGEGTKAYVPSDLISLEDAIAFLKENDALVVLAHPILIKKFNYEEILNKGFDGIEVYHPDQSPDYSAKLLTVAKSNNLLITGGSDYHGDLLDYKFDESFIEDGDIQKFLEKLEEKRSRSMFENKKVIIFDLDQTLIDSCDIWNHVDEELVYRLTGKKEDITDLLKARDYIMANCPPNEDKYLKYFEHIAKRYNIDKTPEEISKENDDVALDLLRERIEYKKDADTLLKILKEKGYTLVLATTSAKYLVEIYLNENKNIIAKADMKNIFNRIYTKESVSLLKPSPEIYELILDYYKISPEEALVFEDSIEGVNAALGAKIEVVAMYDKVNQTFEEEIKEKADHYFLSFTEVIEKEFKNEPTMK